MRISLKTGPLLGVLAVALVSICASAPGRAAVMPTSANVDPALAAAIASPARTPAMAARDAGRHPGLELTFFGLKPAMSVVELWPGTGYWTEILGAYLAPRGHYYVALPVPGDKGEDEGTAHWRAAVSAQASRFGVIHETMLGAGHFDIAPPGSADLVLTFRNLHNWMGGGYADTVLAACFRALKPGGILGIEEHRARTDQPQDPRAKNGYVRQDYTIEMAKRAGFVLVDSSEMNANPRDTKDWVDGVWTLPPTLSQKDKDRDRYIAIGEADNYVMRFRKP